MNTSPHTHDLSIYQEGRKVTITYGDQRNVFRVRWWHGDVEVELRSWVRLVIGWHDESFSPANKAVQLDKVLAKVQREERPARTPEEERKDELENINYRVRGCNYSWAYYYRQYGDVPEWALAELGIAKPLSEMFEGHPDLLVANA